MRQGDTLLPLPATEAAWFQSRHETTTLATHDGRRFVVEYTLEQLEKLLDPTHFFRLNRQLLAQLPAVRRLVPHFGGKLLVELAPTPPRGGAGGQGEGQRRKELAGGVGAASAGWGPVLFF